jgi:rhamnogalacturonyl hydrolase YesR
MEFSHTTAAVEKAWAGLIHSIHPDGKLGSVQPVGASPNSVTPDLTDTYGVWAFLLAGTEVYKMSLPAARRIAPPKIQRETN